MRNFLLVYPTPITEVPISLGMLGAVLKQCGFEVHTCINTFKKPLCVEDFVNRAKEVRADIVGISMITFEVLFVYEIVRALKKNGFVVILGGAHPTDCPQEAIAAGADAVVVGEGEETLAEFVSGKPHDQIKGLITKNYSNPRRPRMTTPPNPDLDIFDKDLFMDDDGFVKGFHRIYTSRGCPGRCSFCDWMVFGQKFVEYDIEKVVEDIRIRKEKYGLTSFSIADDCFTVRPERVFQFCKLIKGLNVKWRMSSRANLVTQEMLYAVKDAGCHSVAFGLESGDPETLRLIRKEVSLEDNIRAPKMAHKAGLEVYGCLMTGFPWETVENVNNQIRFVHEVWDDVSLFQVSGSLMPFPGTEIYRKYASQYCFSKFWLDPRYQKFGIQVYQNAANPYRVSELYQRLLFDDTYIRNEYFFKYTDEYKSAVRRLVWEIGKHNLSFMFKGRPIKRLLFLGLSKLSMIVADVLPGLERSIVGSICDGRSSIEKLRDKRRGIAKGYSNPN